MRPLSGVIGKTNQKRVYMGKIGLRFSFFADVMLFFAILLVVCLFVYFALQMYFVL